MAEYKRNFSGAKMNKDMDERLVAAGDHRDALNVQISSSETGEIGALETMLGNTKLSTNIVPSGSKVITSITDGENDTIYYLVKGPRSRTIPYVHKNYIISYNVSSGEFTYVFVDIIKVGDKITAKSGTHISIGTHHDAIRNNMLLHKSGNQPLSFPKNVLNTLVSDGAGSPVSPNTFVDSTEIQLNSTTGLSVGDSIVFTPHQGSCLEFEDSNVVKGESVAITGINIVDDMLFYTDNVHEPKKINLARSIKGTGGDKREYPGSGDHDRFHTRIFAEIGGVKQIIHQSIAETSIEPAYVEKENCLVIKRNPEFAPIIKASTVRADRLNSDGDGNPVETTLSTTGFNADEDGNGTSYSGLNNQGNANLTQGTFTFNTVVDFKPGDFILLKSQLSDNPQTDVVDYDVRAVIEAPNDGDSYSQGDTLVNGPFNVSVLAVNTENIGSIDTSWYVALEQSEPLFEFKFPRFGFRYKYIDGEYSCFSPWSQPAFLPGEFDMLPKKGYNLGMSNRIRSLKVENYFADGETRPKDIVEIDILYKEDGKPTVYKVKTLKPSDGAPLWEPSGFYATTRGSLEITSELIHAVVESNQTLRPWDNVPRKALAQEVTANRIVYGNYLQNYDLKSSDSSSNQSDQPSSPSDSTITPEIILSLASSDSNIVIANDFYADGDPTPGRSVKSMRTYQVGVVYIDEWGRQTPVLADKKKGSIKVLKESAPNFNQLCAQLVSRPPYWAKYFKFFIKETSNEYYNFAMDRWYNAEDGNVWISVASADRNKIDEETFLILKKQHDTDLPVIPNNSGDNPTARYKVIAVENEAPQFIKITRKTLGYVTQNANLDKFGNSDEGYPIEDYNFFTVRTEELEETFGNGDQPSWLQASSSPKDLQIRFYQGSNRSEWYDVGIVSAYEDSFTKFTLAGTKPKFGADIGFAGGSYANAVAGLKFEIVFREYEDKPEFDGRFFVKILRDQTLVTHVLNQGNENLMVTGARALKYLKTYKDGYVTGGAEEQTPGYTENRFGLTLPYHEDYFNNGINTMQQSGGFGGGLLDITVTNEANLQQETVGQTNNNLVGQDEDNLSNYEWGTNALYQAYYGDGLDPNSLQWTDLIPVVGITNAVIDLLEELLGKIPPTMLGSNSVLINFTGGAKQFWNWFTGNPVEGGGVVTDPPLFIDDAWSYDFRSPEETGFGDDNFFDNSNAFKPTFYTVLDDDGDILASGYDNKMENLGGAANVNNNYDMEGTELNPLYNLMQYEMWEAGDGVFQNGSTGIRERRLDISCTGFLDKEEYGKSYAAPSNSAIEIIYDLMARLSTPGQQFRFKDDPNETVYETEKARYQYGILNYHTDANGNKDIAQNKRVKWSIISKTNFNLSSFDPRRIRHDGTQETIIELLEPSTSENGDFISKNPAIWETEPKEAVDVDLYFELGNAYPVEYNLRNNEIFFPVGIHNRCRVTLESASASTTDSWNAAIATGGDIYIQQVNSDDNELGPANEANNDRKVILVHEGGSAPVLTTIANTVVKIETPYGGAVTARVSSSQAGSNYFFIDQDIHNNKFYLPWFNCYSFGNGVESNRIRDDFNQPILDKGPKASTTLDEPYKEERRGSGMIHSGIYNSTSGVNNLNQFIQAEPITKDLNPDYGTIQKLYTDETNTTILCQDKCLSMLTNKNALFNADGGSNVANSKDILGSVKPYSGDYGISNNPESFARDKYRSYFTDLQRNAVIRLSQDGVTNIAEAGLKDYFTDRFAYADQRVYGSYDERKRTYNLTLPSQILTASKDAVLFDSITVSFSEKAKGWISFYSYVPENAISINNQYYTFESGELWQQHSESNPARNNFYGTQYNSHVELVFNDAPGSVKSFQTINYEGSQSKIDKFDNMTQDGITYYSDGEFFNLNAKTGWYVENIVTDLQGGKASDFKSKEGKWFSVVKGEQFSLDEKGGATKISDLDGKYLLDTSEFSVQGIGYASPSTDNTDDSSVEFTITFQDSSTSNSGQNWD